MKDPAIRYPITIVISIKWVYHPHTGQNATNEEIKHKNPAVDATGINLGVVTSISSIFFIENAAYDIIDANIPNVIKTIEKNKEFTLSFSHITKKKFE